MNIQGGSAFPRVFSSVCFISSRTKVLSPVIRSVLFPLSWVSLLLHHSWTQDCFLQNSVAYNTTSSAILFSPCQFIALQHWGEKYFFIPVRGLYHTVRNDTRMVYLHSVATPQTLSLSREGVTGWGRHGKECHHPMVLPQSL